MPINDTSYITNYPKLAEQILRFVAFVQERNGHPGFISFRESMDFLGKNEDYKSRIAEKAREELKCYEWNESWIGTGKIAECIKRAMNKSKNLVNKNQLTDFKNRLNKNHPNFCPDAERVIFDIYRNPFVEESEVFARATDTFGAKYDTIAYLFFIKDDSRFLPIRTTHFDKSFEILGIDYLTTRQCSWQNYQGYIKIIKEIQEVLKDMLPMQGTPRLIDAHSFVWIIQEDTFINWTPDSEQSINIENSAEEYIADVISGGGGRHVINSTAFIRSAEVVKETKRRANGICQYCNQPAPFIDRRGNPYLEVHHIVWLSRGGEDSTSNTVALCPNCHKRMHYLDKPEDIEILQSVIAAMSN